MPFEFALIDFSTTTLEDMKQRTVERVQQYAAHLAEYRRQSYNETEVRIDFVMAFAGLEWAKTKQKARLFFSSWYGNTVLS